MEARRLAPRRHRRAPSVRSHHRTGITTVRRDPDPLLTRLHAARKVLSGLNDDGVKSSPGMFDSDVISLAHGDGTRRPHHSVIGAGIRALLDSSGGSLDDYLFLQRHEELEEEIRRQFEERQIPDHVARNIVVDCGTTRIFVAFLTVCARPGDVFLVPRSYYHVLPEWCDLTRVQLRLVPTGVESDFKLTGEDLRDWFRTNRSIATNVRGVILFNPTQTGALYSPAELQELGDAIEELGLVTLEDNVFAGTEFPGYSSTCLVAACPQLGDRIVTVMGASKAHNLANIRVGWACGPSATIKAMADYREATLGNVPQLVQSMALAALVAPASYLRANNLECATRADLVEHLVEHCNESLSASWDIPPLAVVHNPRAGHGMLLSLDVGGRREAAWDSLDATRMLLCSAKVAVGPGCSLGFDGAEIRLAVGSVGLKTTYQASASLEAAAALEAAASHYEATVGRPYEIGAALGDVDSPSSDEAFRRGRRLIERAFLERILPALKTLQRTGKELV